MTPDSTPVVKIVLTFSGNDDDLDIVLDSEGLGDNLELVALYLDKTITALFDSNYYNPDITPRFPTTLDRTITLTYSGQTDALDINMVSEGLGENLELIAMYLHRTIQAILASEEQMV